MRQETGPATLELRQLRDADQKERQSWQKLTPPQQTALLQADRERRERTRQLLEAGKVVTAEDFDCAALIFQHGERPDNFLMAHELAVIAAMGGRFTTLPALAEDRFLESVGRKQRFGSQFGQRRGESFFPTPVEEGRASVTDALRAAYLLPPFALVQKEGMAAIQKMDLNTPWVSKAMARIERLRERKGGIPALEAASPELVLSLYQEGVLQTVADYRNAARALQSTEPLLAHELAVVAAIHNDAAARELVAPTLAAFLKRIGFRRAPVPRAITQRLAPSTTNNRS